jgi:hypothetical protein
VTPIRVTERILMMLSARLVTLVLTPIRMSDGVLFKLKIKLWILEQRLIS